MEEPAIAFEEPAIAFEEPAVEARQETNAIEGRVREANGVSRGRREGPPDSEGPFVDDVPRGVSIEGPSIEIAAKVVEASRSSSSMLSTVASAIEPSGAIEEAFTSRRKEALSKREQAFSESELRGSIDPSNDARRRPSIPIE